MSHIIEEKWDEIITQMRQKHDISNASYKIWLEPLRVAEIDDESKNIIISVDDRIINLESFDTLNKKYLLPLKEAIAEFTGEFYSIEFLASGIIDKKLEEKKNRNTNSSDTYLNLSSEYTFDNFVIGPNNNLACAAALAVAESPSTTYNPLFIYGGPGLGKTHLMSAIARHLIQNNPHIKVLYVTSEKFMNELIDSIRLGKMTPAEFKEKYRNVDVLLIDDIQFIIGKESTQEEFFHTFNALYEDKKQIIISSDRPPKEMNTLEERLRSRFEWGLTVDIQQPDYETRMAILKEKKESFGYTCVSDEMLDYIATNVTSNIRNLEGALKRIDITYRCRRTPLTFEDVKEALKDLISSDNKKTITVEDIVNITADHFGINQNDIYSNNRSRNFAYPRQIVMYLSRQLTTKSATDIASILGGRDHSTVLHGINKITEDVQTNKDDINTTIDTLIKKINPPQM